MVSIEGNLNPYQVNFNQIFELWFAANFFSSGLIFLAELAEESWRDLAAVWLSWINAIGLLMCIFAIKEWFLLADNNLLAFEAYVCFPYRHLDVKTFLEWFTKKYYLCCNF